MTWQCRRCGRTVDLVLRDGDRCAACAVRTRAGRTLPDDDGAADPPVDGWDVIRGVVPFVVELRVADFLSPLTKSSMLRHVSNHAVGRAHRVQGAEQALQITVAPNPPEVLLGLH